MRISSCILVAADGMISFFFRLGNIPWHMYGAPLSIHLLMDMQVISVFWLLRIVVL